MDRLRTIILVLYLSLPVVFCATSGRSQVTDGPPPDTTVVDTLGEVIISRDRYPISAGEAGAVSYHLGREEVQTLSGSSLGEGLTNLRNLHVMTYGGGSSLQTISVRGMGSEHALILLDGIPVQNIQTGVNDLRLIDTGEIQDVEILPGGTSALFGSDAVAGAILLRSRTYAHVDPGLDVRSGIGSFGGSSWSVRLRARPYETLSLAISTRRERANGEFPFTDSGTGGEVSRSNQDYTTGGMTLSSLWSPSPGWKSRFFLSATDARQGVPGPFFTGVPQGKARQHDRKILSAVSTDFVSNGGYNISLSGVMERSYERYLDTEGFFPADNYYSVSAYRFSGQAGFAPGPHISLRGGVDLSHANSESNSMNGDKKRNSAGIFTGMGFTYHPSADPRLMVSVTPSARVDWISEHDMVFNPKIGANMAYTADDVSLRVHSTLGRSVRIPTLNELYYAGEGGAGNPELRPERSVSFDAGLEGSIGTGSRLKWDVTYYSIRLVDRILWLPTTNSWIWSPVNIASSLSHGMEFTVQGIFLENHMEMEWNYSTISAKKTDVSIDNESTYEKQLIYIPTEKTSVNLTVTPLYGEGITWGLRFRVTASYVGRRFTVEDNSESLSPYLLVNGTVSANYSLAGIDFTLTYRAGNLLGESYEVLPGYPMPLSNHSFGIELSKAF